MIVDRQDVFADLERVAGMQDMFIDAFTVDEGAITALEILHIGAIQIGKNTGMMTTDRGIGQTHVVVNGPADLELPKTEFELPGICFVLGF